MHVAVVVDVGRRPERIYLGCTSPSSLCNSVLNSVMVAESVGTCRFPYCLLPSETAALAVYNENKQRQEDKDKKFKTDT